jgi:hypothetical protein
MTSWQQILGSKKINDLGHLNDPTIAITRLYQGNKTIINIANQCQHCPGKLTNIIAAKLYDNNSILKENMVFLE